MAPPTKRAIVVAALLGAVIGLLILLQGRDPERTKLTEDAPDKKISNHPSGISDHPLRISNQVGQDPKATGGERTAKSDQASSDRAAHLDSLKQRWDELGRGNVKMEERKALAIESAHLLGCSEEAVQLITYLDEKKYFNQVFYRVEQLFSLPRPWVAREMLVELPAELSVHGISYKERWSLKAGKGCSSDELDAFLKALGSPRCAQEALFGYNEALMLTDPMAAISSTLQALEQSTESKNMPYALDRQMQFLPSDVDFEELVTLFPKSDDGPHGEQTPIGEALPEFFKKWARVDAGKAANYVMAAPDSFSPKLISPIAAAVLQKDLDSGIGWVQTFPDGPYFDAAAQEAVLHMRVYSPERAHQMASLIGDPELRKREQKKAFAPITEKGGN